MASRRRALFLTVSIAASALPLSSASALAAENAGADRSARPFEQSDPRLGCPNPPVRSGAVIVAMGDSYSAGEGMNCYHTQDGNAEFDGCHRSRKSWAVGWSRGAVRSFVACTGAVMADITDRVQPSEFDPDEPVRGASRQIDAISSSTVSASLTIGGNDVRFADILTACLTVVSDQRLGRDAVFEHLPEAIIPQNCEDLLASASTKIRGPLPQSFQTLYRQILAKADGMSNWRDARPNGSNSRFTLVVATYPTIFPKNLKGAARWPETGQFCRVANVPTRQGAIRFGYTEPDIARFRTLQTALNNAIRQAVAEIRASGDLRIRVANLDQTFPGNTSTCGLENRDTPFVNGLLFSATVLKELATCANRPKACLIRKLNPKRSVSKASFHITKWGHGPIAKQIDATLSGSSTVSVPNQTLPHARSGVAYSALLTSLGGGRNPTWSITAGALPGGLTLDNQGRITGTPDGTNVPATFTVRFATTAGSASRTLRILTGNALQDADWPTEGNDGSPALWAYFGASLVFPDWVQCESVEPEEFCVAGFGDYVQFYSQHPLNDYPLMHTDEVGPPYAYMKRVGFTDTSIRQLLGLD